MTVHDVMMGKERISEHLTKLYVGGTTVITHSDIQTCKSQDSSRLNFETRQATVNLHISHPGCEEKRCDLKPFAVVEQKSPQTFAGPMLLDDYCE